MLNINTNTKPIGPRFTAENINTKPIGPRSASELLEVIIRNNPSVYDLDEDASQRVISLKIKERLNQMNDQETDYYEDLVDKDQTRYETDCKNYSRLLEIDRVYNSPSPWRLRQDSQQNKLEHVPKSNSSPVPTPNEDYLPPDDYTRPPRIGSGANWKLADQLYELANFYHIRDHKPDDQDDFIPPAARDMYMQARIVSNIPLIKSIDSEWMNGLNTKNVLEYFQHGVVLDLLQFRLRQDHKSIATATVKKE